MIAEIVRMATEKGGHVLFTVHRRELVQQIVNTFIEDGINLQRCTILTIGKVKNRLGSLPTPTLIITDETHHALAKTYRTVYDYWSDVPRLGFSASPWRLSGQGLGDVYDDMVEGPTVSWLIDHQYLAPFDYYAPTLADIGLLDKASTGDFTQKSIDEATKGMVYGDVVKHYRRLADGRQAIIYAPSVDASKRVVTAFNAAGITAEHADAKTHRKDRERIMADFKAGRLTILSNVDLISEGFNVPDCGVVIMLRPTASLVLDIQQSMRGMRYRPGKRAVIIDHVANVWRFGPPDMPRNWTLDNRKKRTRKQDDAPAIRTCPQCFAVIPGGVTVCPVCGFIQPKQAPKPQDVDETAKLKKVTTTDFKMQVHHPDRRDPEQAKSFEDLASIGKTRGYKPGWAYYQAKARGFKLPQKKRRA